MRACTGTIIVLTLILLFPLLMYAQHKTATSNGDWNSAGTWGPAGVPGNNQVILIPPNRTVTVRGTDHILNNSILVIRGTLIMESTCGFCNNYGSLTFTGASSGVFLEEGARVRDNTLLGGDTHFIKVNGTTFWSGDNCNSNCGTNVGNFSSPAGSAGWPSTLANPLPVVLGNFYAETHSKSVKLSWNTINEENNDGFEVERSYDAINFVSIGFVKGAGTSNEITNYTYLDSESLNSGYKTFYYRLKQIDMDGNYEYSTVIQITNDEVDPENLIEVWPNPFNDRLNILINAASTEYIQITLISPDKGMVKSESNQVIEGLNQFELNALDTLPNGVYFVVITGQSITTSIKVIK